MLPGMERFRQGDPDQIFFAGDTVIESAVEFEPGFESLLNSHAVKIFNFEGPLTKQRDKILKAGPHLMQAEKYLDSITNHFNVAVLANNHTMDYGAEGLEYTLEQLHRRGVATIGAGTDIDEAFEPLDVYGYRFIAVAEHEFGAASEQKAGIATVEEKRRLYRLIKEGKEDKRQVIILFHGGVELMPLPAPYVREWSKLWIDYGADLVVCSHPHVVQGYETYKEKAIFYSLGNFIFNRPAFHNVQNGSWSLGVSINFVAETVNLLPLSCIDGKIDVLIDKKYMNEIERLSDLIDSDGYMEHCLKYIKEEFKERYPLFQPRSKDEAALILHYFRCDAHRNFVSTALSDIIGEQSTGMVKSKEAAERKSSPESTADTVAKEALFKECYAAMQMSENEKKFLTAILRHSKACLETGSGSDTIWFSQFVDSMHSVEAGRKQYSEIKEKLEQLGINNVDLFHFPPEPAAYDEDGRERWKHRVPSDYGKPEEFTTYLHSIGRLLEENNYDVVLVKGNCRYEVIKLLRDIGFDGVVLLYGVLPGKSYLNDPIISLPDVKLIRQVDSLAEITLAPYRLEIGGQRNLPGWIVTDQDKLDITNQADWEKHFTPASIRIIFAEHVLEHLEPEDTKKFFTLASKYLIEGGYIRIAVPDEQHPSGFYRDFVKPGGIGVGSDDHKYFFNGENISDFFDNGVYKLRLLEWWDDEGFHQEDWNNSFQAGFVKRCANLYNYRFADDPEDMKKLLESTPAEKRHIFTDNQISYTSLIFDLVKKETKKKNRNKTEMSDLQEENSSVVEEYYDEEYYAYQREIGEFGGKANLIKFEEFLDPSYKILDFGCGGGYLLNNIDCRERWGVEINPAARKIAAENGVSVYASAGELPDNYFDLIISNHVLEHLVNPLAELQRLKQKLRPGGRIIFVVPHQDPREPYHSDDVNKHLYTWNQMTLGNLFAAAGFSVEKVDALQHQWMPDYLEQWEKLGEQGFHKACIEYAKKNGNYQIRIAAGRK